MTDRILYRFINKHTKVANRMVEKTLTRGDIQRVIDSGNSAMARMEDVRTRDVVRKALFFWGSQMANRGWGFPYLSESRPVRGQEGQGRGERKG